MTQEQAEKLRVIDVKLGLLWVLLTILADQTGVDITSLDYLGKEVGWKTDNEEKKG